MENTKQWPIYRIVGEIEAKKLQLSKKLADLLWRFQATILTKMPKVGEQQSADLARLELVRNAATLAMQPALVFGRVALWRYSPYWLDTVILTEGSRNVLLSLAKVEEKELLIQILSIDQAIRGAT